MQYGFSLSKVVRLPNSQRIIEMLPGPRWSSSTTSLTWLPPVPSPVTTSRGRGGGAPSYSMGRVAPRLPEPGAISPAETSAILVRAHREHDNAQPVLDVEWDEPMAKIEHR